MALTVTAGGAATAAQYNALIPLSLVQGSDQAFAANTTYADHNTFNGTNLQFAVGTTWIVEVHLAVQSTLETGDAKLQWVATGGSAVTRRFHLGPALATTAANDTTMRCSSRSLTASVPYGVDDDGTTFSYISERLVVVTTVSSGTLALQVAQNAAFGTTTFLTGSYLIAHRVA